MKGRPKKPTAIKKDQGTLQKCRENPNEPQPAVALIDPPGFLDEIAVEEWYRVGTELVAMGLVAKIDAMALACYCAAVSDLIRAEKSIQEDGLHLPVSTKYGKSFKSNPAVTAKYEAMRAAKAFMVEFGMTPASRSKVSAKPPKNELDEMVKKYLM